MTDVSTPICSSSHHMPLIIRQMQSDWNCHLYSCLVLDQTSTRPKEWKTRSQYHQKEMSPTERNIIIKRQAMLEANLMIPDPFSSNKDGLQKILSVFFPWNLLSSNSRIK